MAAEPVRKTGSNAPGSGAAEAATEAARARAAEAEAAEKARRAEQEAAERKLRAEQKAAERKLRAEQKAAERKRRAEQKAVERKQREEQKAADKARREEEARLAEEKRKAEEEAAEQARQQAAREATERAVAAATAGGGYDARGVLREIARPRLTGSRGGRDVASTIRACFEALGYQVDDRPFRFNPWPGRFGITAVGVLYLVGTVAAAGFLHGGHPFGAIALLLILLVVSGLFALFVRPAIDALSFGSQEGVNMMAQKPGSRPRYIIMAHRDSKSQPVPLSFRGPAIVVAAAAWLALLIAAAMHSARALPGGVILLLGALAAAAGVILILCWVDNSSPGALDNASGVTAALGLAAREAEAGDVAFLITDAEELGLAGARAAASHLPAVFGVINLDGLDDEGTFYVLERFGTFRKTGLAPHLAAALLQEADARGEPADRRDLPFGIPVDHIPVVNAGVPALTLMRGSFRSLQRVHRPGDDLEHLRGDGVERAIELVGGALVRLRDQSRPLER
jgi:hypothetical protein